MLLLAVLCTGILATTTTAQIEEAQRIIYVVKSIKRIAVKHLNFPDASGFKGPNTELKFEITAFDEHDQIVNLSPEQAKDILDVRVKNPLVSSVVDKKTVRFDSDRIPNTDKYQHVVKMMTGKDDGSARLEIRIAEKYSKYSKAIGRQLVSTGGTPGKESMLKTAAKNTKNWVVKHPYIATGAGVVVIAGAAAAGGSGGGGGSSSGTDTTAGSGEDTSAIAGPLSGSWAGTVEGQQVSGSFSVTVGPNGTVYGSFSGYQSGSISGSVTENGVMSAQAQGSAGTATWSGNIYPSGGGRVGSGSWSGYGGGGSWSGSGS